jgi:NRPS condensation-like uncharacterized protein
MTDHPATLPSESKACRTSSGYEWEITPAPDVDPLDVVVCSDDNAPKTVRANLQSLSEPLVTSPPLRIRLARHRKGDVAMLNLHPAAGNGIAVLGLLRSIARVHTSLQRGLTFLAARSTVRQWTRPVPR